MLWKHTSVGISYWAEVRARSVSVKVALPRADNFHVDKPLGRSLYG